MTLDLPLSVDYAAAGAQAPAESAHMTCYLLPASPEIPEQQEKPLVLVCPGGAYRFRSAREAEPVAMQFLAAGIHAAVVHYSVAPNRYPCAALELAYAVQQCRRHAAQWHVDPDRIFILGFSAGGHLCATLGTLWKEPVFRAALGDAYDWKPDAQVLCYPVITMGTLSHSGSRDNLLGPDAPQALYDALSLEKRVSADTVPTFLWHTVTDDAVPVENTMHYALALRGTGVPFEMHLYETGCHGLSLCTPQTASAPRQIVPDNAGWIDHAVRFLRRR